MKTSSRKWLLFVGSVLALNLAVLIGLIDGWGRWYSFSTGFRRQTDAFLQGSVALDTDPGGLDWDLLWVKGGVHQPWGLGVPVWRLPFECVARVFGYDAFPDRIALAAALAVVAYIVLRVFVPREIVTRPLQFVRDHPESLLAVPLLLLFPPFLTMCRGPFLVYDETQAYSYLAAIALLAGMIAFLRQATFARYVWLLLFAGLTPFIRPTLIFYAVATLLVAGWHARRLQWPGRRSLAGIGAFGVGLLLLFASNLQRFGSGLEFGHSLNLNTIDAARYATRFDAPFRHEPILSASRELFSILFLLGNTFNTHDRYGPGQFAGQSPSIRWREFYFETYDLSYFALIAAGWLWTGWHWWRRRRAAAPAESSEQPTTRGVAAWSLLCAALLFLFYLRCPYISSRYLIDFAPAFAAAMWVGLAFISQSLPANWIRPAVICTLFGAWWVYQVVASETDPQSTHFRPITYAEMKANLDRPRPPGRPLPNAYELGADLRQFGIPFNGAGWDTASGATKAAVALFIRDPQRLEIEVAPTGDAQLADHDYDRIQAKVGLEFLKLESSRDTPAGRLLIFHKPQRKIYQSGVQVAFLGMIAPQDLSEGDSKFRLLRVRWR